MLSFKLSIKNLIRSLNRGIMVAASLAILVVLIFIYIVAIKNYESKLEDVYENAKIDAVISFTPSTLEENRVIPIYIINKIMESKYIKDSHLKLSFSYYNKNLMFEQFSDFDERKVVITSDKKYLKNLIENAEYTFNSEYDLDTFLGSDKPICIVNKARAEELELNMGDTMDISFYPSDNYGGKGYQEINAEIVGTYNLKDNSVNNTVYMPFDYYVSFTKENILPLYIEEATFELQYIKELQEIEKLFKTWGFANSSTQLEGMTCTIDNTELARITSEIKKNISLMESLFPSVYGIILFIGFIIAYMQTATRKRDVAIMMSIGTKKSEAFITVILENIFLCLLGAGLGILLSVIIIPSSVQELHLAYMFSGAYILGSLISIASIFRVDVFKMLSVKE